MKSDKDEHRTSIKSNFYLEAHGGSNTEQARPSEIDTCSDLVASTLKQFKTIKKRSWPSDKDTQRTSTLTPSTSHFVLLCVSNDMSPLFLL